MNCYLCNSTSFSIRKGQVRDSLNLKIYECTNCRLVFLSSLAHIKEGFYENSGMHANEIVSIDAWLKDTDFDDQRRFDMFKSILPNKRLLDFGSGACGFLNKAKHIALSVSGIEPETRVQNYWLNSLSIYSNIEFAESEYDLITAFHVIEHLPDPIAQLKVLAKKLAKNGLMILEVPNSEDALLTIYDSEAFQSFSYWSQHLFLFNAENIQKLAAQSGLRVISIQQYQRYSISNHLYWLSKKKPGGHQKWAFLDSPELKANYSAALAGIGKCDTIIAYLELDN